MAVSVEYLVSTFRSRAARPRLTRAESESTRIESSETRLERARWELVALGAGALYLFFVTTLFWSPVWLLVFTPFVLLGVGRLTGLRSLWSPDQDRRDERLAGFSSSPDGRHVRAGRSAGRRFCAGDQEGE